MDPNLRDLRRELHTARKEYPKKEFKKFSTTAVLILQDSESILTHLLQLLPSRAVCDSLVTLYADNFAGFCGSGDSAVACCFFQLLDSLLEACPHHPLPLSDSSLLSRASMSSFSWARNTNSTTLRAALTRAAVGAA